MNVTTEKVAEGQVALTIEVERAVVEKAMNQAYHRLAIKTPVRGFRKGKAPRAMIERYLGRGALMEEALQRLIPEVFGEAAKECQIRPVAEPKYEVVQVEPVIIKATVDVAPVVELGNYQEIRAALSVPEVTEADADKAIEQQRQSMATWESVDRPVVLGDRITADIHGTKDRVAYFISPDYPYAVHLESPVPVPGFAGHLVGMTKGEEREFDLSFPPEHENPSVAGHDFHFRVTVKEISREHVPTLDDDFAKQAGEGLQTLEELRRRVREDLAATGEHRAKEELVEKVVSELVDISTAEIPPSLVDHEVHRIIQDQESDLKRRHFGLSQYLSMTGKTSEQHHDELQPVARNRLKRSLVLDKFGEAENIKAEPAEVDAEIDLMVGEASGDTEQLRKFLATPNGRELMERTILNRKTLHRLVEIATEGAVSYPELPAPPAVEAAASAATPSADQPEQEAGEAAQE